jgi:hypothetical protein
VRNYSFLDFPSLYLVSTEGVLQAWEGRAYQYGMNNLRSMGYPVDGLKFDPDLVCAQIASQLQAWKVAVFLLNVLAYILCMLQFLSQSVW